MSDGMRSGGALDTREARVETGGERLDGAGLGEARRPLNQHVPAGQDADGEPLDQPLVADEPRRGDRLPRPLQKCAEAALVQANIVNAAVLVPLSGWGSTGNVYGSLALVEFSISQRA
jgi:hypothetical protein